MSGTPDGSGDGGLTKATMRSACGLRVEHRGTDAPVTSYGPARARDGAQAIVLGVEDEEVESVGSRRVPFVLHSAQVLRCHISLLTHCLNDGLDLCSEHHLTRFPLVWSEGLSKEPSRCCATEELGVLARTISPWQVRRPSDPEHPSGRRSSCLILGGSAF